MTTPQTISLSDVGLSFDQAAKVDSALRALQNLKPIQDKMEACGIDCVGFENLRQTLMGNLTAVKQHFGTKNPLILS